MKSILITSAALTLSLAAQTKIACVGDSITFGAGVAAREKLNYPAQLGYLLGDDYEVRNFGVSARTMLNKGDRPYTKEKAYQNSLSFEPNIVIIKLGTNDSKPHNWKFKAEFSDDTKSLIKSYRDLPTKPRIILCQPVPVAKDRWGITEKVVRKEVAPLIRQTALEADVELFDFHPKLINHLDWIPDGVHPNAFGAEVMARSLHTYLTTERDETFTTESMENAKLGNFHGYAMQNFKFQGTSCKVVSPKVAAKGKPWVWRARFWGHQPQFDVTMLELGWHVVYCDVANLFGAPKAIERWDKFYYAMQSIGLSKTPFLEGMSRGGLPIHNWALANPKKVAGLYGDNCVMDIKSWPAGFGSGKGHAKTWEQCKNAYGFKSDDEAKAFKANPIDTVEKLKQAGIPLLYLVGTADDVVPGMENAQRAAQKLDGYAELILKEGKGHHPHALPNPKPIVDFALRCNYSFTNPAALPSPSAEFRGGPAGWGGGTWWDQLTKINQLTQANQDLELIFFGDSISQSWTGSQKRLAEKGGKRPIDRYFADKWKTASFGISGDRTEHLLYRLQNGNFDGLNPKAVVLMIGVNNLLTARHSADQITGGIEALVEELTAKLPETEILLLGPFPSGQNPEEARRKTIAKIQQNIAPLGDKERVTYLDLAPAFTNPDGSLKAEAYSGDKIHLRPKGYEIWAEAILPTLEKISQ
ncbi:GDSL-type esterase/lipase family protein [Rubritalea tangerina]|uniref:GDSL-type esterase/lipase family protein n=1 Tax=Rubritalea tangerina TaxID=430798 RepID=A0ABW4ZBF6_9BACT